MAENLSSSQILQWTNDVTNNIGKVVNTADSIRDTIEAIEKFTKGKNVDESILKVLSSLKTTMQRTITGINKLLVNN